MKYIGKIIAVCFLLGLGAVSAGAQGKIETKKYKIRDLQEKITKVVMTGNAFCDGALRQDVVEYWHISPFELCSLEEFKTLQTDPNYYFLLIVSGQFSGEMEPGIDFLTFLKGGPEAEDGIGAMTEVISIPFRTPKGTGREIAMIPAFLDIIQDFALKAMERDLEGYQGLSLYNRNLPKIRQKNVVFAESDLSFRVTPLDRTKTPLRIVSDDDADDAMIDSVPGTVVSYTVAPEDPSATSRCYKMLIGTDNHVLYYFKRHRITGKTGSGFTAEEFKSISRQAQ